MGQKFFRKDILSLPARQQAEQSRVRLDHFESPSDIALESKVELSERLIKTDFNRAPQSELLRVRKLIARHEGVLPDQVILAPSLDYLIQALVIGCSIKGKVAVFEPSRVEFARQAQLFGNRIVSVPLGQNFFLPAKEALEILRKENPQLLFLSNPNVPTGNSFDREGLARVVAAARSLVVIDESFALFAGTSLVEWLAKFPHLVLLKNFSHAQALAGCGLAYALGDSEVIELLSRVVPESGITAAPLLLVEDALTHEDVLKRRMKDIIHERQRVFEALQSLSGVVAYPSDGNFILLRVPAATNLADAFLHRGVAVLDIPSVGVWLGGICVTIGSPRENDLFLDALKIILNES